ncbi:MAG: hypothetical protein ACXAEU_09685 [Candidatus Hodarchaeales archaeon]|jgi:hypothetical protein
MAFSILEKVNVHTCDVNGNFIIEDRRNVIRKLQSETPLVKVEDTDCLLVYRTIKNSNNPGLLFSVHIDTVFDKHEHCVEISPEGTITGTLDNTASIAAIIEASKIPTFNEHIPVFVSYTGGEEVETMLGARETLNYFQQLGIVLKCAVVLDITAEHFDRDFSIENYFVKKGEFKDSIANYYNDHGLNPGFVPPNIALPDETMIYRDCLDTFSLCLPVRSGVRSMHQTNCTTSIDKLESLIKAIGLLPIFASEWL